MLPKRLYQEIKRSGYNRISAEQVGPARKAGLFVHKEVCDAGGGVDYYAATPEWVSNYYQSGGTWDYR